MQWILVNKYFRWRRSKNVPCETTHRLLYKNTKTEMPTLAEKARGEDSAPAFARFCSHSAWERLGFALQSIHPVAYNTSL
jgi:hypothetical protein